MVTEAEQIAELINGMTARFCGTLRFWGEWFGRPYDNCHRLVACEIEDEMLRLSFNEGEILRIWSPRRTAFDAAVRHESGRGVFRITDADRIRWEWFYYGRPQTEENRYFMAFRKTATGIAAETDIDWYKPDPRPTPNQPALEVYLQ